MAELVALKIVTPEGVGLATDVRELTAPSVEGEFGVLPGHRPMLAALRTGIVSYIKDGEVESLAVGPGFVEVADDKAVLLTQRFMKKGDVDPVVARKELKEAEDALVDVELGDSEREEWIKKSLWAAVRLELYGDPPPPTIRVAHELGQLGHASLNVSDTADDDGERPASNGDSD